MKAKKVIILLSSVATLSTGEITGVWAGNRTIQASISGVGAVSATVEFYGSNLENLTTGVLLATIALSGNDTDNSGDVIPAEYAFMWAKITALSGTNSKVTATVCV